MSKTNCEARISVVACADGRWKINSLELNHNHSMSPNKARFYSYPQTISANARRQLELNDDADIRLNKSYNTFLVKASGHENVPF